MLVLPEIVHSNGASSQEIEFTDVSYSVPASINIFSKKRKTVLHDVSGKFIFGQLTAIMGPSGCGKTSLLDILAGYRKRGYTGTVLINGESRSNTKIKSCYIMQEENLHPLLTTYETMMICANLKIGNRASTKIRKLRVKSILQSLNLELCAKVLVGKLSGGQRKRLGIALELLDNPPIMFFDEPTSGLDCSSTKQCIAQLQNLARQNRAVICTIHQPSAKIFEMFDHLYCLYDGQCCYSGDPKRLTEFLRRANLVCPEYHNPADFFLEVIGGEHGSYNEQLIGDCENGKSAKWRKTFHAITNASPVGEGGVPSSTTETNVTPGEDMPRKPDSRKYNASFIYQVNVLVRRIFLTLLRDKFHMVSRLFMHWLMALIIGTFFYNIGLDAGRVLNNFSLLFFSSLFLAFGALQSMIISFPTEVPVIRREYFNKWYSVAAYYAANTIADLPIQLGCTVLYCTTVYWMSGQPSEFYRFFLFTFMCTTISLLAQAIGYFIGSSMKVKNGVIFGPFFIMPWVMMSGYFIQKRDAPYWAKPVFDISYLRHGIEGLAQAIYGYSREKLPCITEDYCHFRSPSKALQDLDLVNLNFTHNVTFIMGVYVLFKVVTYFVLVHQLKNR